MNDNELIEFLMEDSQFVDIMTCDLLDPVEEGLIGSMIAAYIAAVIGIGVITVSASLLIPNKQENGPSDEQKDAAKIFNSKYVDKIYNEYLKFYKNFNDIKKKHKIQTVYMGDKPLEKSVFKVHAEGYKHAGMNKPYTIEILALSKKYAKYLENAKDIHDLDSKYENLENQYGELIKSELSLIKPLVNEFESNLKRIFPSISIGTWDYSILIDYNIGDSFGMIKPNIR